MACFGARKADTLLLTGLVLACGARSELYAGAGGSATECVTQALATHACKTLAFGVPPTTINGDVAYYGVPGDPTQVVTNGDHIDLLGLTTVTSLHVGPTSISSDATRTVVDLCLPVAARDGRFAAFCDNNDLLMPPPLSLLVYDDTYAKLTERKIETHSQGWGGQIVGGASSWLAGWTETHSPIQMAAPLSSDGSALANPIAEAGTFIATACGFVALTGGDFLGAYVSADFDAPSGTFKTFDTAKPLSLADGNIVAWPYDGQAVVIANTDMGSPDAGFGGSMVVYVVDPSGVTPLPVQVPLFDARPFATPLGLVLIGYSGPSLGDSSLEAVVIAPDGAASSPLVLSTTPTNLSNEVSPFATWSNGALVVLWNENTPMRGATLICAD